MLLFGWDLEVDGIFKEFLVDEFVNAQQDQSGDDPKNDSDSHWSEGCRYLESSLYVVGAFEGGDIQKWFILIENVIASLVASNNDPTDYPSEESRNSMEIVNPASIMDSKLIIKNFGEFVEARRWNWASQKSNK